MTPADEMRTAAARLRDDRNCDNHGVDSNSSELLAMISALRRAREPLAAWLERAAASCEAAVAAATEVWGGPTHPEAVAFVSTGLGNENHALAAARAVNAEPRPGHVQGGRVVDRLDPANLLPAPPKENRP